MADAIPNKALVVVADSGRAIFFRNSGNGIGVSLHEERRMVPNPAEEQGPSGARPVEQSQHQTEGATFVNVVAHALHAMLGQNAFKDLVLVAPPETLGELRSAIHKTVAATVVRSLSKDLTHQTTAEIEKALAA